MHLFLTPAEGSLHVVAELQRTFVAPPPQLETRPDDLVLAEGLPSLAGPLPPLAFARQVLPDATAEEAASIRAWAERLFARMLAALPDDGPWCLHLLAHYGGPGAGAQRCRLIQEALRELLQKKRRHLLRRWDDTSTAFTQQHHLVQLLLTSPNEGFLAITLAPIPGARHRWISPWPGGEIPVASDKAAPSRAFAKLLEAELRLGHRLAPGESCVDLGACPGSWSYVALNRGCRVIGVDRSPVRPDVMNHAHFTFHPGDAFRFEPERPVDWLLCDVIAAPQRSIDLLLRWLDRHLCHRFIVTLKFKGTDEYPLVDLLKQTLPTRCTDFLLARLCANKNEVCAAGIAREASASPGPPASR